VYLAAPAAEEKERQEHKQRRGTKATSQFQMNEERGAGRALGSSRAGAAKREKPRACGLSDVLATPVPPASGHSLPWTQRRQHGVAWGVCRQSSGACPGKNQHRKFLMRKVTWTVLAPASPWQLSEACTARCFRGYSCSPPILRAPTLPPKRAAFRASGNGSRGEPQAAEPVGTSGRCARRPALSRGADLRRLRQGHRRRLAAGESRPPRRRCRCPARWETGSLRALRATRRVCAGAQAGVIVSLARATRTRPCPARGHKCMRTSALRAGRPVPGRGRRAIGTPLAHRSPPASDLQVENLCGERKV
jgi:hypothetical protein